MEIRTTNLRFLRSNAYIPQTEYDLLSTFELKIDEFFFPEQFNRRENYNYIGKIPPLFKFLLVSDNEIITKKKEDFVSCMTELNYKWNFQRELNRFCDEKLWILTMSCLKFINNCYEFEISLKKSLTLDDKTDLLLPFGFQLCSLSSYTYKLFKLLYLNNENMYCILNEYGHVGKNVSKLEYEWACFNIFEHPEKKFLSAFNNKFGQKYFKEAIPDLYSPVTKEALFFNGCVPHSHYPCLINKKANKDSISIYGVQSEKANQIFEEKLCRLIENNPNEISKVTIHWECNYLKVKQTQSFERFYKTILKPHPLLRLRPRTCVRGSYSDVYKLKWTKISHPNEKLYFLDVNGLFSYACTKFPFMIGKYDILIGEELKDVKIINNKLCFKNNEMYGTILLTILPPKNLFRPYLQYRTINNKVVNTLCSKCCEKNSKNCKHTDSERAITSSYFISEINYALHLDYKILNIFECHYYKTSSYIFKDFVTKLNAQKLKSSNIFKNCLSDDEKLQYCNFLNSEMDLTPPFNLTLKNVRNNPSKRFLSKLMANSFFGKFQQKCNTTKTTFVNSQANLEDIFFSNDEIKNIFCFDDKICQLEINSKEIVKRPNFKTNCYIGGLIVSYGKQIIYEYLNIIEANGGIIYQVECDSVLFSLPQNTPIPVRVSDSLGDFKLEIEGEILSYFSFGPKNYSITYQHENQVQNSIKISGLSLNNALFKEEITEQLFEEFLNNLETLQKKTISQIRTKKKPKFEIKTVLQQCSYSNQLTQRRYLQKTPNDYTMFPFGYNDK